MRKLRKIWRKKTSPRKRSSEGDNPRRGCGRPALVSACALGIHCRYDGSRKPELIEQLPFDLIPVPVCPEQIGGFPTPRPLARIHGGDGRDVFSGKARVVNEEGMDVTEGFIRGARETVMIAARLGIAEAYLVEKSPSCGVNLVWTGNGLCPGMGVAAAALAAQGVRLTGLGESE